jgi:hypothetical protein
MADRRRAHRRLRTIFQDVRRTAVVIDPFNATSGVAGSMEHDVVETVFSSSQDSFNANFMGSIGPAVFPNLNVFFADRFAAEEAADAAERAATAAARAARRNARVQARAARRRARLAADRRREAAENAFFNKLFAQFAKQDAAEKAKTRAAKAAKAAKAIKANKSS